MLIPSAAMIRSPSFSREWLSSMIMKLLCSGRVSERGGERGGGGERH